jgi:DNA polymerase (family 10)
MARSSPSTHGWLTKDDVINTWPLQRLRRFLRKGRAS